MVDERLFRPDRPNDRLIGRKDGKCLHCAPKGGAIFDWIQTYGVKGNPYRIAQCRNCGHKQLRVRKGPVDLEREQRL